MWMYCGPLWHLISNFGSKYARDLFLVSNPRFFGMGNHLTFRWTEKTITWWMGCRRACTASRSEIVTLVLNMVETCFCCHTQGFFCMGNHLGPWLTVTGTDRPKLQFHSMKLSLASNRDGKRCQRCQRCWCKKVIAGVKFWSAGIYFLVLAIFLASKVLIWCLFNHFCEGFLNFY